MPGGGTRAPFEPGEHDVVSTKLRSWNLGHPGNLAYADLLVEYALKLPPTSDPDYSAILSQTTRDLVEEITVERGGRFLKIAEGENHPSDCIIMDFRACHHKVIHGLKNKQKVILTKGIPPKPTKITKPPAKNEPFKQSQYQRNAVPSTTVEGSRTTGRPRKKRKFEDFEENSEAEAGATHTTPQTTSTTTPTPIRRRRRRVTRYEARQTADGTINPYALELISYVCNHQTAPLLEKPGTKYSRAEEEPVIEREIRLQLRHRFFAAKAMKMSVVDFSKKLLEVWGGSLMVTSVLVAPPGGASESPGNGIRKKGTRGIVSPNTQSTGTPKGNSSDESAASPQRKKMPQKEPRKMSTTPQFADLSRTGWGNQAAAPPRNSDSSSSDDDSGSSDDEDSDSDSSSAEQAPTYTSPYGFGTYGLETARRQSLPSGQSASEHQSSEEGGSESEGEGSQYGQSQQYQSNPTHDLNLLTAAANYELESMRVGMDDT